MRKSALFGFGLVVTMLVALGLVVLTSASVANAFRIYGDEYFFIKRQFVYIVAGIALAAGLAKFDYRHWRNHPWLVIVFFLIVFALLWSVFGFRAVKGSHRWLTLGPLHLQPSEFAKLMTVIVLAVLLDRAGWHVELFKRGALYPSMLIGLITLPVLLEPDFGSVMVIGTAGLLMMFVAGTRILHLLPFIACGVAVFVVKVAMNPNRMARLSAFFGGGSSDGKAAVLDAAAKSASFQVSQALIAFKNGGIGGAGLGESMQKHYYLPEAHTDFIFAVGAEELGLFFTIGALVLYILFFAYSVYIARKATDRFGRFLVIGMAFIVFFQAMFNLGVVCKALPTKGMALPFFSYGGTNLLCTFFAVGTILSVGIHSYREVKRAAHHSVFLDRHGRG